MSKAEKKEEAVEEKGQTFNCGICNIEWHSKVKRAGMRLCEICVELRRALNGFTRRGLETEELRTRVEKILG